MSELAKCWTREIRKARKAHKCCECRGEIKPGELYEYFSGIWDYPETFKTCLECAELRADADKGQPWDEKTPFTCLGETVFESREPDLMRRYIETKDKRGAQVSDWMRTALTDATT